MKYLTSSTARQSEKCFFPKHLAPQATKTNKCFQPLQGVWDKSSGIISGEKQISQKAAGAGQDQASYRGKADEDAPPWYQKTLPFAFRTV